MPRIHLCVVVFAVSLGAGALVAQAASPSPSLAEQALASVPQGKGLCVHIGCGSESNPDLTAELAARSRMLVHGLAVDDASTDRARKAIEAKGLAGQASVEKAALSPLPYLPNLVNLVVIEDWGGLSAKGLIREEVLRVLAPGGTMCVLEKGQWTRTVKPRPAEMDDWPCPMHDAGLTRTSRDKAFAFPIGLRWTDGLPNNIAAFTDCCGWVVVKNTLFTLSSSEFENVGRPRGEGGYDLWLVARDAFNGLPLWKLSLQTHNEGLSINAADVPALAADEDSVYTAYKGDRIIRVDSTTGRVLWEQSTKYKVHRLILTEGVVVAGSWSTRNNIWFYYFPDPDTGATEAFDASTGKPLWQKDITAEQMTAGDDVVHIQLANATTSGNKASMSEAKLSIVRTPAIVGLGLRQGDELWRFERNEGEQAQLQLTSAGPRHVVVTYVTDRKPQYSYLLSSTTGKVIVDGKEKKRVSGRAPFVDGMVWFAGRKIDPETGEDTGNAGAYLGGGCTPNGLVWPYVLDGRGGEHWDYSKVASGGRAEPLRYYGARAACLEGMVIANGMLYTAQNGCKCMPSHLYGFLGLGPCGPEPTAEDFTGPRPVEKGPAFAAPLDPDAANDGSAWPTLRADAARSASSKAKLPAKLKEVWGLQVTPEEKGPLAAAWDSQLTPSLSPPVVAAGLVFVSARDQGQIVAFEAATGKKVWTRTLASRIDGPPTYWRGLCIVGCRDGRVYALRAGDGRLAWQTQVAPASRRIVDHGRVESLWPAPGSVLVQDGVAYATAGRTSESDGGIALVALDAATGKTLWARQIAPGALRMNDILSMKDGQLAWRYMRLDKATGKTLSPASLPSLKDTGGGGGKLEGGLADGTYTMANNRRAGGAFDLGGKTYDLLAWNDRLAMAPRAVLSADGQKELAPVETEGRPRVMGIALAENAAVYSLRSSDQARLDARNTLKLVSLDSGKTIQQLPLKSQTAYDGLAIAGGKLFVSFHDGRLICLGE